jgi:hypothetical protein
MEDAAMAAESLGRHIDFTSPRGYYLDYSGFAREDYECNDRGLPTIRTREGVRAWSPPLAARAALGNLEVYLESGNPGRRDRFTGLTDGLVRSMEILPGSFAGWPMPEEPKRLGGELGSGWFSAAAHAECISVLVRAAYLLRRPGALDAARRAMGAFHTSVDEGGFLREVGEEGYDGGVASLAFIEEYPIPGPPRMTLSSHVLSVWAMHDYLGVEDDPGARVLLGRCVNGLAFVLDRFDLGYWTAAHLEGGRPRPARSDRHATHILMMDVLARMTGSPSFAETGARWREYARDPRNRARARLERAAWAARSAAHFS